MIDNTNALLQICRKVVNVINTTVERLAIAMNARLYLITAKSSRHRLMCPSSIELFTSTSSLSSPEVLCGLTTQENLLIGCMYSRFEIERVTSWFSWRNMRSIIEGYCLRFGFALCLFRTFIFRDSSFYKRRICLIAIPHI